MCFVCSYFTWPDSWDVIGLSAAFSPHYASNAWDVSTLRSAAAGVSLVAIVIKVAWAAFLWGAGTAIGELPPYFVARAAAKVRVVVCKHVNLHPHINRCMHVCRLAKGLRN